MAFVLVLICIKRNIFPSKTYNQHKILKNSIAYELAIQLTSKKSQRGAQGKKTKWRAAFILT
jgi:hypothetical protein